VLLSTFAVAIIAATVLTFLTPNDLFNRSLPVSAANSILPAQTLQHQTPQPVLVTPTPVGTKRIGIISGHKGNDSGAVCPDGLTEASVNFKIATIVVQNLIAHGYTVDLLDEFDDRLPGYQAALLLSIHNDSCEYINPEATGFKVAAAQTPDSETASHLTDCLVDRYHKDTGLIFDYNAITPAMTEYHAFDAISSSTPAAIIEAGFLNLDRQILTQHTDVIAKGITDGLLCFLNNETVQPTAIPTP
jgi:N-acetylmuramoyl-L-alanine amidase